MEAQRFADMEEVDGREKVGQINIEDKSLIQMLFGIVHYAPASDETKSVGGRYKFDLKNVQEFSLEDL